MRSRYALVILIVGTLSTTSALGFGRFGYTMILPSMKEGLKLSYTQMGLLGSGNFLGYLIFSLVGGLMATIYGPRRVISLSMFLVGMTMFLTGLAEGFAFALAMRTLTGAGSGGVNVPVMSLPAAWFSTERRGMAAGVLVAGSGLGLIITGRLVPWIISLYGTEGWRYCWYYLGLFILTVGLASFAFLRDVPAEKGPLLQMGRDGPSEKTSAWFLVFKNRRLWHLAAIYFLFGFSYIIYATFFAASLILDGLSPEAAGWIWALVGLLSISSGFIFGTFSDYIGRERALALVFGMHAIAYFTFSLTKSPGGYYISAILFGLSAWSIPSIMAATVGDYSGSQLAPAALGFITVIFGIGQAIGPGISGFIADLTSSFSLAFPLAGVAASLGTWGSWRLRSKE